MARAERPGRALVGRRIEADEAGTGLLDRERPNAPEASLAGRRLGRWELGEEIRRGEMSVVYSANAVEGPSPARRRRLSPR